MSNDPFEQMRRRNPMPPDQTPMAPMGVANSIVGSRASWPGWAIAAAAAVAVVVIGGGTMLLMNQTDTTVAADATTSLPPVASSSVAPMSTTVPVATTEPAVTVPPVVPPAPVDLDEVIVYFIIDDPTATGSSQSLVPVARSLVVLSTIVTDLPRTAVEFLLVGPNPGENESIPSITSAVPDGTRLLDLSVSDGVATVDLSSEFAAGSGSFSEIARLDQLIYTLTRFDEIDGVRLKVDGVPIEVFGGHGIVLDDPVIRTEFDTTLPAILIESPAYMSVTGGNPLTASGTANVFEASVSLALTDSDGLIIWEGFTTATCGTGCLGEWAVEIPYSVEAAQMGALIAWEESARDGSQVNVREHPVWLVPLGDSPIETTATTLSPDEYVCSGGSVEQTLLEQSELPAEVATMRAAIFAAAVSCDWEALRALQDENFMFSFGGPGGDAIASWQELELLGEQPMRYLAGLLNRPFAVQIVSDVNYHVWPSAFATEWSAVSAADREALRPLYDEEDFAGFSDFGGYFGYRIGITDGTWTYFIAGD